MAGGSVTTEHDMAQVDRANASEGTPVTPGWPDDPDTAVSVAIDPAPSEAYCRCRSPRCGRAARCSETRPTAAAPCR